MMKTTQPTWAYLLLPLVLAAIYLQWNHVRTANAAQGTAVTADPGFRQGDGQQTTDDDDGVGNNRQSTRGRIIITKQTIPAGSSETFRFTTSYHSRFSLRDGDSHESKLLRPGQYSVTESTPASWTPSLISCSDNSENGVIDVASGETVVCTFTSTNLPLIRLEKTVAPALIGAGEVVTYGYLVEAVVPVFSLANVSVTDDKCSPVIPVSNGQLNSGDQDNMRDVQQGSALLHSADGAAWRFTCATPIYIDTTNVATATARVEGLDLPVQDAAVAGVDVRPAISVALSTDRASVPERGADVTFTMLVANLSDEEALLEAFDDSIYGNLDNQGTCSLPQALTAAGETYTCAFTKFVGGGPGESAQQNLVTVTARDSENNSVTAQDEATVAIVNAAPQLLATKRDLLYLDADGDDMVSVGDTVLYIIRLSNVSNITATSVTLKDQPDPRLALQSGSVQTSRGVVVVGNGAGDREVLIELGSLAPGATANVGLRVTVNQSGPGIVLNQAVVQFSNPNDATQLPVTVLSDDPDTPAFGDPTVTPVRQPVTGVDEELLYLPLVDR